MFGKNLNFAILLHCAFPIAVASCPDNFCSNGGTCVDIPDEDYKCICPFPYYGLTCADVACGDIITVGNSVTSPQYPQSYPANANCKWLLRDRLALLKDEIMTKPTSLVLIALQLADSIYDCNKDFIEIYTDTNELQGRYCREADVPTVISFEVGSAPYLTFQSDSANSAKGFELQLVDGVGCDILQCMNGGSCVSPSNITAECQCPVGFVGKQCEIEETCGGPLTATSVPQLLSFHNCSSSCDWLLTATTDGSLVTVAFSEILSDDCSKPQITVTDAVTGESLPIDGCGNNATVVSKRRSLQIHLDSSETSSNCGFKASFYEVQIDNCAGEVCQNGGTCVNQNYNHFCQCTMGFQGPNCESSTHPCVHAQFACLNGGSCVEDPNGQYHCNCTATGYTGDNCETFVNSCEGVVCQNGGTCLTSPNEKKKSALTDGQHCECPPLWTGSFCGDPVPEDAICDTVLPNTCGHGKCVPIDDGTDFSCQCDDGYTGEFCETPPQLTTVIA